MHAAQRPAGNSILLARTRSAQVWISSVYRLLLLSRLLRDLLQPFPGSPGSEKTTASSTSACNLKKTSLEAQSLHGFDHLSFKVKINWSCVQLKPRTYICSPQVFPSEDASALIVPDCHQRGLCDLILFSYSDSLAAVMNISDVHFFIFDLSRRRRRSGAPSEFEMLYLIIPTLSASQTQIKCFWGFLFIG